MTPAALATVLLLGSPPQPAAGIELPFEVHARFEARETVSSAKPATGPRGPWTGELALSRARLGIEWKRDDVEVVLEAELQDDAELKDAWARLELARGTAVRAGQFKMPLSGIERESSWDLPTARRGELHDVLGDGLQVTGRRPGAEIAWGTKRGLRPKLLAGAWQSLGADGKSATGSDRDLFGQAAGARASISPGPVTLGASGTWRSMEPVLHARPERHWAAGVDAALDAESGARAWVEVLAGSSPLGYEGDSLFGAARAVAAWRIGGARKNAPYVEPFALAAALDPDDVVRSDLLIETAAGINAGRWDRWRVQVQVEESRVERNFSPVLLERTRLASRRAVLVQMAVSF